MNELSPTLLGHIVWFRDYNRRRAEEAVKAGLPAEHAEHWVGRASEFDEKVTKHLKSKHQ